MLLISFRCYLFGEFSVLKELSKGFHQSGLIFDFFFNFKGSIAHLFIIYTHQIQSAECYLKNFCLSKKFSCSCPALTQFKFGNSDELRHRIRWAVALSAVISLSRAQHQEPRNRRVSDGFSWKLGFLWKCLDSSFQDLLSTGRGEGEQRDSGLTHSRARPRLKKEILSRAGWQGKAPLRGFTPQFVHPQLGSHATVKWLPGTHGENTPQILTSLKCI